MEVGLKARTLLRIVLDADDCFEHVQFYHQNERLVGVTRKGTVYSGEIVINKISAIYKLKSSSTSLNVFVKGEQTFALIALEDGSLLLLNIETKSLSGSHPGFGHTVKNISLHPWSERVVTTFPHSGIIWDISNGLPTPLQRLNYPGDAMLSQIFFGPNGDNVISCFADGTVIAWDFPSLEYQTQLPNVTGELSEHVEQFAVSGDARVLLLLMSNSKLVILDLFGGKKAEIIDLPHFANDIAQMEILTTTEQESARIAVFLLKSGILTFVDLTNGKVLSEITAKLGKCIKFALSSELKARSTPLAAMSNDGHLEIFHISLLAGQKSQTNKDVSAKSRRTKIENEKKAADPRTTSIRRNKHVTKDTKLQEKPRPTQIVHLHEFESMLDRFGEFPAKYRTVIWKHVLGLPLNEESFSALLAREMHPAYANIDKKYPIIDSKLLAVFKRMLSSIAHWCCVFAEIDYLPVLVFPFVKVFHENPLTCFEIILTYLVHWCHDWFQYFPAPPYHVFAKIETIMEKAAPLLHSHFKTHEITCRDYAWPLLESSFSDIFTTDEWLSIWDHICVSKDPNFVYSLIAAYMSVSENTLLRCTKLEDFQKYFHNKNPVSVKAVLTKAKEIVADIATPLQRQSRSESRPFVSLSKRTYPMFSNFPMTAVKNHASQMQKIRQMEAEYVEERKAVLRIEAEYGSLHEQEDKWKRKDAILRAADYLQRQEALREEQQLLEQRSRLRLLKEQLKMKECALLESKKRQLQREYQYRSEARVATLEDTCRWIATLRQTELAESNAESEMRHFKNKIDKCAFEIDLLKKDADTSRKVDDHLHSVVGTRSRNENPSPRIPGARNPEIVDEHRRTNYIPEERVKKSPTQANLNLEEQLAQLEKSNKNMEMELNQMMANLASSHVT